MAGTPDISPEAAKTFFDAILKQSELLGSWSLAVFGACVVLIAWYVQRRLERKGDPNMRALSLVFLCGFLQGVSILLMYFAYGGMVNVILTVQFSKFENAKQFYDTLGTPFQNSQDLFAYQFLSFFVGIILLGIFALRNYHLVKK